MSTRQWLKISDEEISVMRQRQNGLCAICKEPKQKLGVDHNHLTNAVRALLCDSCNFGLGCFKDNPDRLKSAIEYLIYHQWYPQPPRKTGGTREKRWTPEARSYMSEKIKSTWTPERRRAFGRIVQNRARKAKGWPVETSK